MSELNLDSEHEVVSEEQDSQFEPVCLDVDRIYDSCGAKDCLRDLPVFFSAEDQALVETAASVRVTRVNVITSTVSVDPVPFHRGYYSVDVTFYFSVCCEVYTGAGALPATVNGLATFAKRVVLYGSDGNVKTFTSDSEITVDPSEFDCCTGYSSTLPLASVHISCPMPLASELSAVSGPVNLPVVSEPVLELFGGSLAAPTAVQVLVTIGIFTIVQLSRRVQLMLPSYDFCLPRKECDARTDDPCEAFSKIEFPTDSFFPPNTDSSDSSGSVGSFNCGCA